MDPSRIRTEKCLKKRKNSREGLIRDIRELLVDTARLGGREEGEYFFLLGSVTGRQRAGHFFGGGSEKIVESIRCRADDWGRDRRNQTGTSHNTDSEQIVNGGGEKVVERGRVAER